MMVTQSRQRPVSSRATCRRSDRNLDRSPATPGLVVASFLTPSTRERLRAAGLNYLDLTGNIWLTLAQPGLYIETR